MTRRLAVPMFVAATLVLGACATPPPAPPVNAPADIAAINALRAKFQQVFNAGDASAVGNLYTVDAIAANNHQPSEIGRDAIAKATADLFAQFNVKFELTAEETQTMGDFGYDRGRFTFALTPKTAGAPAPPVDEGRYLVILKKDTDGQWRVSRDIGNSSLPMPMPAPEPPAKKGGKK